MCVCVCVCKADTVLQQGRVRCDPQTEQETERYQLMTHYYYNYVTNDSKTDLTDHNVLWRLTGFSYALAPFKEKSFNTNSIQTSALQAFHQMITCT